MSIRTRLPPNFIEHQMISYLHVENSIFKWHHMVIDRARFAHLYYCEYTKARMLMKLLKLLKRILVDFEMIEIDLILMTKNKNKAL